MTSAMLLEYEDNNVGEDEVCKGSKDQHGGSRTKRRRGRPQTALGRFMFQRGGIGPPLTAIFMQVRCDCASG
jgi:hypothetical protein